MVAARVDARSAGIAHRLRRAVGSRKGTPRTDAARDEIGRPRRSGKAAAVFVLWSDEVRPCGAGSSWRRKTVSRASALAIRARAAVKGEGRADRERGQAR